MSFTQAVSSYFTNYANFNGRSPRSAYWWVFLFNVIVAIILGFIDRSLGLAFILPTPMGPMSLGYGPIYCLYALAVLIPSIAIAVRRLHDRDSSGWWLLIAFIPFIGAIVLLVWFCLPGTPGDNRFGSNPLGGKS